VSDVAIFAPHRLVQKCFGKNCPALRFFLKLFLPFFFPVFLTTLVCNVCFFVSAAFGTSTAFLQMTLEKCRVALSNEILEIRQLESRGNVEVSPFESCQADLDTLLSSQAKIAQTLAEKRALLDSVQMLLSTILGGDATHIALENTLLAIDERIRKEALWEGGFSAHWQGESHGPSPAPQTHRAGLGLWFHVDQGNTWEWLFDIGTMSPLREGSGEVDFPLQEADLATLRSSWLLFKRLSGVQLRFGLFPDTESVLFPKYWSFAGLEGRANLLERNGVELLLFSRHDRFDYLSPQATSSQSLPFERNKTRLVLLGSWLNRSNKIHWTSSYGFHWYTDSQNQLSTLSLGRQRYVESKDSIEAPDRYRVSHLIGGFQWQTPVQGNLFHIWEVQGEFLSNHSAARNKSGLVWRFSWQNPWNTWVRWSSYRLKSQTLPPIALFEEGLLGQPTQALECGVRTQILQNWHADFSVERRFPKSLWRSRVSLEWSRDPPPLPKN
jgi:hypothetical protein